MDVLYADDLVLAAENKAEAAEKFRKWREMDSKGLRTNTVKTKVMHAWPGGSIVTTDGVWPCAVCQKGIRNNSIPCGRICGLWVVQKRCNGIKGRLQNVEKFECAVCRLCVRGSRMDCPRRSLLSV